MLQNYGAEHGVTFVNEEQAIEIANAMQGWDTGYKERVRECQAYLSVGMLIAGACAMGILWCLAPRLHLERNPLFLYRVPWWAWLIGFITCGGLAFFSARSLFLSLEGRIRAAHQAGLRQFMEAAKSAGIRLSKEDVLGLLSDPDFPHLIRHAANIRFEVPSGR
jgi:hypothetical protein